MLGSSWVGAQLGTSEEGFSFMTSTKVRVFIKVNWMYVGTCVKLRIHFGILPPRLRPYVPLGSLNLQGELFRQIFDNGVFWDWRGVIWFSGTFIKENVLLQSRGEVWGQKLCSLNYTEWEQHRPDVTLPQVFSFRGSFSDDFQASILYDAWR
jgi:hypothetical protein